MTGLDEIRAITTGRSPTSIKSRQVCRGETKSEAHGRTRRKNAEFGILDNIRN